MERTIDYYNHIAPCYDAHFNRPIDLAENRYVFGLLSPYVDGKSVLDLGCGTGLLLEHCQPSKYLGVDIAERMLEQAIAKNGHCGSFVCEDMAGLDVKEKWDSVVSTFGSFSFCLEPMGVVDTIRRALKPSGHFFIMAYGPRYQRRSHHISPDLPFLTYRSNNLLSIFNCFNDVKVYGVNSLPDWLNLSQSTLYNLLRWEARTIGKLFPSLCYFLVIEGSN